MAQARTFLAILLILLLNEVVIVSSYNMAISLKLNVKKRKKELPVCNSADCNKAATGNFTPKDKISKRSSEHGTNDLLEVINLDADPCKDFYKFACGKFLNREIPPDRIAISTVASMHDKLAENLKSILEEGLSEARVNFAKQTKLSFYYCMDTNNIDKAGLEAINAALLNKFGGWPLLDGDKWREEEYNLTSLLVKLQMHNMMGLFKMYFHKVDTSTNFKVPLLLLPSLSLPPDNYQKDSPKANDLEALSQLILNMSLYLGKMEKTAKLVDDVNETVEFEIELSQCFTHKGTFEEQQQRLINMDKLKEMFQKSFDFETFFKSLFKEVGLDTKPNMTIGTFVMPYLSCLSTLLEATPKRKLINYLIWKVVEQSTIAMPSTVDEIRGTFKQKDQGSQIKKPRWKICTDFINTHLHRAVGYLYMLRGARYTIKTKVYEIIADLKKAYAKLISKQKWLTEETKTQALIKLEQMRELVAYPNDLQDQRVLDAEFKGVDFNDKAFADIFFEMNALKMKQQMNSLKAPVDRDSFDMPIAMINAFYEFQMNRIVFPAGILEVPFFSESYPKYLNFAGIGYFIGHEIIHGFDNTGSRFDYEGLPSDWWQVADREMFTNRSECFIHQYSDLVLEQINEKVNGRFTLGENIADSGGLRIAHMAYKTWLGKNGEEEQLPGLPYNSEQMFFISYARNLCQKLNSETAAVDLRTDRHSPNIFRVNMPLKNMKAFTSAFQCKRDSEMTIRKRCRVW